MSSKGNFKVVRVRLNMLGAASWQTRNLRAMKKESGAENVVTNHTTITENF